MKLIRSWPFNVPSNRSHVVDAAERLVLSAHDYQPLRHLDEDVLLLEWDIAVGAEDLRRFANYARDAPDSVLVAPYLVYNGWEGVWAHRRWNGEGGNTPAPNTAFPVAAGDSHCQLFGLGMIYLPREIVRAFFASGYSRHSGDMEISMWHYRNVTQDVPIVWDVLPVHLNYPLEGILNGD